MRIDEGTPGGSGSTHDPPAEAAGPTVPFPVAPARSWMSRILAAIEPFALVALAIHGWLILLTAATVSTPAGNVAASARPAIAAASALMGMMGASLWLRGRSTTEWGIRIRALVGLALSSALMILTGATTSLFLLWLMVVAMVYMLTLPVADLRWFAPAPALVWLLIALFDRASPLPPPTLLGRFLLLALITGGSLVLRLEAAAALDRSRRRERIQRAVARAAGILQDPDGTLEDALRPLLAGTTARSVFVERNVEDPELGPCSTLVAEVARHDVPPDPPGTWQLVPWRDMPQARLQLSHGRPFAFRVEDLTGREREVYEGSGIVAELDIPIFTDGRWVGLIGFADDSGSVSWDASDIELLRGVAELVGAFWKRQATESRLRAAVTEQTRRRELDQALARCARILLTSDTEDAVSEALATLLPATGAHDIFIDENVDLPDVGLAARITHEAIAPGWEDIVDSELSFDAEGRPTGFALAESAFPELFERLARGEAVIVVPDELDGIARSVYAADGVRSELNVPIFVGDRFTGSLGVADYAEVRTWDDDLIRFLETAAVLFGAFFERRQADRRLRELIESKDEFIASVSHELRTPLTAVVGLSHELRDPDNGFGEDERAQLIDLIAEQSIEVANIVEDLLVAARSDIGTLVIRPRAVDLAEQVDRVLSRGSLATHERAHRLSVETRPVVAWADEIRVRQIVRNLVTNALRYGGERIRVVTVPAGSIALLQVRDDGAGVPPDAEERIFEPYVRLSETATQPNSIGLGLPVSRQLARLMGGDIVFRREGDETVFELRLPAAGAVTATTEPPSLGDARP